MKEKDLLDNDHSWYFDFCYLWWTESTGKFLKEKKLVCYGGTAINNILPKRDQFYKPSEFPDYDFFSNDALNHAKKFKII